MGLTLTYFQGRAGDHNDLAIPGARAIAQALAEITGSTPLSIGKPQPALSQDWRTELALAMPELQEMQAHFNALYAAGNRSLAATSRCAVSLATLPAAVKYHPDLCVVWFDSHADLNTPTSTQSGYLGGLALSGPAGLWESGLGAGIDLSAIILVGQRDLDPFEQDLIADNTLTYIPLGPDYLQRLQQAVKGRPVYIHLDCDVLEPGIVPTDYQHPGGMQLTDLKHACEVLAQGDIVGLEIAEFQHQWQSGGEPVSPRLLLAALAPVIETLSAGLCVSGA